MTYHCTADLEVPLARVLDSLDLAKHPGLIEVEISYTIQPKCPHGGQPDPEATEWFPEIQEVVTKTGELLPDELFNHHEDALVQACERDMERRG